MILFTKISNKYVVTAKFVIKLREDLMGPGGRSSGPGKDRAVGDI